MEKNKKVVIIGAGLSGSLLSIYLIKLGYQVDLYERRVDMRNAAISAGRSINLALSDRGILPLKQVGIYDEIIKEAVPMPGRLIHDKQGNTNFQSYSAREGEYINSISRGGLNKNLMNYAEELGVKIFFNEKCTGMDFNSGTAFFLNEETEKESMVTGEVVIGTDGAGSAIRDQMMKESKDIRFSYSQSYLEQGYKELTIPANEDGSFKMEKNALHIWPRGSYMMIALPNFDGSFTVTLFMPFEGEKGFNNLNSDKKIMDFFKEDFPDVLTNMPSLLKDFYENPASSLATVKCFPWQVNGKSLLIGDSAHAVVPFYGQGMNASFEDCRILVELLKENNFNWPATLIQYQDIRKKDTDAIADLAVENFYEMRDHVANPVYMKKKKLELALESTFKEYFSKYSMVTFRDDLPYSEAKITGHLQDEFLMEYCKNLPDNNTAYDLDGIYEALKAGR